MNARHRVLGVFLLFFVRNADAAPTERFTAKMLDAQVDEMNLMHLPVRLANGTTLANVKRLGRTLIFEITGDLLPS